MDRKKLIIIGGILVVFLAVMAAFILTSSSTEDSNYSKIAILGEGAINENGSVSIKLTNGEGIALKDKEIHVTVKDSNGSTVFEDTVKTFANGVVNVKIAGVPAGEYDINATFDGDENFTGSSVAAKLTIKPGESEEPVDNSTATDDNVYAESQSTSTPSSSSSSSSSSYSRPSSSSISSSSSSSSSSDSGGGYDVIDEDGHNVAPVIDEDGNPV